MEPCAKENTRDAEPSPGKRYSQNHMMNDDIEIQSDSTTILDRASAAMLLQTSGYANVLRVLTHSKISRSPGLYHAWSALYLTGNQEKRRIDPMPLALTR